MSVTILPSSHPTSHDPAAGFVRTRWWWVRHAPVRAAVDGGRIYGAADVVCDCGDAGTFEGLASLLPRDAVWVTSHLGRTRQTAEAIWAAGYLPDGAPVPDVLVRPALAEQHLGDWQGQDRASFFAARTALPGSWWFAPAEERAPGGESFSELCDRVRADVDAVTRAHPGRSIVAVAHGGSIRAALAMALDVPAQTALAFAIENCSITAMDHLDGPSGAGWRVRVVNQPPR